MPKQRDWKLLELLNETANYLKSKGFSNPRLDAELLLAHVLRLKRLDLYLQFDRVLLPSEIDAYRDLIRKRLRHDPIQYIIGETEFMGLRLAVDGSVLIPRPETEILVETVLSKLPNDNSLAIADIGTGSGAIAVSLAHSLKKASLYATDISMEALAVARRNAEQNGVVERIVFLHGDLFGEFEDLGLEGALDAVVSNPPYIRSDEMPHLPLEVREYEPSYGLDGGANGLSSYRRLIPESATFLKPGGWLAVEIGEGQVPRVSEMIREVRAFESVQVVKDLNRVDRVLLTQKIR